MTSAGAQNFKNANPAVQKQLNPLVNSSKMITKRPTNIGSEDASS
jgi:hypothetical protein